MNKQECQICYENRELKLKSFLCFQCGILCCYICSKPDTALKQNKCPQCRQNINITIDKMFECYNKLVKRDDYQYLYFAQYKLAVSLIYLKDYEQAFYWFESSAMLGFNISQFIMGFMYVKGYATKKDINMAYNWIKLASLNNLSSAKTIIAMLYHKGKIVEQNMIEARRLYLEAANEGELFAQYMIASIYNSERNFTEAKKWFKTASDAGCTRSRYMLGIYNEHGIGTWCGVKNRKKAFEDYKSAAYNQIINNNTKKNITDLDNSCMVMDIYIDFIN